MYRWILHSTRYTTGVHNRCYCRLPHLALSIPVQTACTAQHAHCHCLQYYKLISKLTFEVLFIFCKYYIYTMSAVIRTSEKVLLKSTILIKNTHKNTWNPYILWATNLNSRHIQQKKKYWILTIFKSSLM